MVFGKTNCRLGRRALAVVLLSCFVCLQDSPAGQITQKAQVEQIAEDKLRGDEILVLRYRNGLRSVLSFVHSRPDLFPDVKRTKPRIISREDKEAIWAAWKSFLDYILALDAVRRDYSGTYQNEGPSGDRPLLLEYAAFLAQYRFSLEFIARADKDSGFKVLLNEPVPELGLPKGTLNRLKFRFLNVAKAAAFAGRKIVLRSSLKAGKHPELCRAIREDSAVVREMGKGRGEVLTLKNALQIARDTAFSAWFPVQAGIAEWMGDTKVRRHGRSLVSFDQIQEMKRLLEPGDIILERREWYLSNIGLPGFWPHAALYIGTPEEREKYFQDTEVQSLIKQLGGGGDLEDFLRSKYPEAHNNSTAPNHGHPPRIIEAMSEGVTFTSLEHSADADSIAVLRPLISKPGKVLAIAKAFHYWGRPYDFNFDFLTDSSLVCSEVVCKAYEPGLRSRGIIFRIEEILGRKVITPNGMVRQFDAEYGMPDQQMTLVLFLDGNEKARKAVHSTIDAFRQSWKRPKWHILVQGSPPEE